MMLTKLMDTKRKVKSLRGQVSKMNAILEAVAEKLEVAWEEDDNDSSAG
jgi:hypothetical protein